MCLFNSPSAPEVKEVQKPQEVKQVEQSAYGSTAQNQQNKSQMGGATSSTLLTGANGVPPGALTLGKTTLLGQ
jgi:hypothetical protein